MWIAGLLLFKHLGSSNKHDLGGTHNLRGTTNFFFTFVIFGQEQQKLGAELYHPDRCTARD
ncbi:MAG TPA: hypothetical protein DCS80_01930 [Betaproteobacteria bacterium]|nr:hypothetical protein [Betaproteobacteria bacterium]